eukprot:CAMPEP_0172736276 /NCGR_PEP_ID=MMETSP1074-20121228/114669_1 /TAXON_ID=2916 /ORGANISM="Ceratium fusus, Strain PA161109" /LENGTH=140 /DNA_ID=CAMNT_0013565451 /DNA_START=11 /DNA_END=429 /DNA_ORIENTATION=-
MTTLVYDDACSENCMTPRATMESTEPRSPSPNRCGHDPWDCRSISPPPRQKSGRPVPALCRSFTPPPLQQNVLRAALKENKVANLQEVLKNDPSLVHIPLWTSAGCEPPCVAAVRIGCSVHVLDKLLQHGASAVDVGCGG